MHEKFPSVYHPRSNNEGHAVSVLPKFLASGIKWIIKGLFFGGGENILIVPRNSGSRAFLQNLIFHISSRSVYLSDLCLLVGDEER